MAILMFKTKGMVNPKGKSRVYFTCHPDDFIRTFDKVSGDLLKVSDCAIYYTENMNEVLSDREQETDLSLMNLFVIPVTRKLLENHSRAMDADLLFAKRMNIPVLPIMFDSNLDRLYGQNDKFGEMQYINPFSSDKTEISYEEKLKKFLTSVLVSDETAKRVRSAFDAYMFLSYRKKDRFYANELMRLIHSNRECRDIAIWYDEYLVPGESFNENISKMLNDSKLFTLLVTPNLLEEPDGIPNFVMGKEYPAALELGMEIVAAEMESTDRDELSNKFKGVPECVNPREEKQFKERLIQALRKVAVTSNDSDPEHNYLIGLAYRDGIDVEVDRQRGLDLIKTAAETGHIEAASDLAKMYYYGIHVAKNNEQAAYWQEKKTRWLRKECDSNQCNKNKFDLIDALRFYTEIARDSVTDSDTVFELIECCEEALELCDTVELSDDYSNSRFVESRLNTLRSLAILYENSRDFDKAIETYEEALRLWKIIACADEKTEDENTQIQNKWRIAQIHHDMGILYGKKGSFTDAITEYEKSLKIYDQLCQETTDLMPNALGVHNALAHDAVYVNIGKALKHSEVALNISKFLYDANPQIFDLLRAKTLLSRSFVLSESGSSALDELEAICLEAVDIFMAHKDDGSHETIFNLMNVLYKLASVYRRKCEWNEARKYYIEATHVADQLLRIANVEDKEAVAHLYFDYGTFSVGFSENSSFDTSIMLLNKALELFREVSSSKPNCKQYVDETESVLRTIRQGLNSAESNVLRKKLEENDSGKIAALYQFQHFYEKGDAAERARVFDKAIMNYQSALEQMEILEELGESMGRLSFADIYDRIAFCYELSEEYDEAKKFYAQALLLAVTEAKETEETKAYDSAINYAWKLASFCEEFGDKTEAQKHYEFREFLIEEKSKLQKEQEGNEDFLSPELKAELSKALDDLDFTPSTFKEGEEIDYSKELLPDGESDLSMLFETLFGSLDDAEDDGDSDDSSVITLTDEDGNDTRFEFADLIKFLGNEYVVLIPCEDGAAGVVILQVESDGGDTENYIPVEDESLLSVIFEMFKERNKDKYNFTD